MGTCCETEIPNASVNETPGKKQIKGIKTQIMTPKVTINIMNGSEDDYRQQIDTIWEVYDEDKSGVLDEEEAKKLLKVIIKEVTGTEPTQSELKRNFMKMDKDRSGDIDKEECIAYLRGVRMGQKLKMITG